MQIMDIKESGANNILMYALSNGANIKSDDPLMSLINDELFFLVTLSDVNAFELFRLTQMYRDKLRIINEHQAELPSREILTTLFPGECIMSGETEDMEKKISKSEIAEHSIQTFINIATQMMADDDIIHTNAARMFLPMISRKFDVQFPVSFVDIIQSMSDEETSRIFNNDYPNTLQTVIDSKIHGIKTVLSAGFVGATQILRYGERYDKYLKAIKYAPLKLDTRNRIYKYNLIGFKKFDNISRSEVHCSLFKTTPNSTGNILRRMKRLNTPLELEFAVQMPIQYMQLLENSFGRDILTIAYESSMSVILETGIIYNDFKTLNTINDAADDQIESTIQEHDNQIEAYRVRIAEANQTMMNGLDMILKNIDDNTDVTSAFAMLPSIYMVSAVITINANNIQKLIDHTDPILVEMFSEMASMFDNVNNDIRKAQ